MLGPDYNLDDQNKAAQQTAAVIEQNPDLAGVFGTNVFSAQGAGNAVVNAGLGGHVQVVAYDATKDAIELLNKGDVTLVLAQKPFDMGYMAVQFAAADAAGVTSLPQPRETGFAIIDKDNVNDPNYCRFIYKVRQIVGRASELPGSATARFPVSFGCDTQSEAAWPVLTSEMEAATAAAPAVPRVKALHADAQPVLGLGLPRPDDRLLRHRRADLTTVARSTS